MIRFSLLFNFSLKSLATTSDFFSGKMNLYVFYTGQHPVRMPSAFQGNEGLGRRSFFAPHPLFFPFVMEEGHWLFLLSPLNNDPRSCSLLYKMCTQTFVKHGNESQDPKKGRNGCKDKDAGNFSHTFVASWCAVSSYKAQVKYENTRMVQKQSWQLLLKSSVILNLG